MSTRRSWCRRGTISRREAPSSAPSPPTTPGRPALLPLSVMGTRLGCSSVPTATASSPCAASSTSPMQLQATRSYGFDVSHTGILETPGARPLQPAHHPGSATAGRARRPARHREARIHAASWRSVRRLYSVSLLRLKARSVFAGFLDPHVSAVLRRPRLLGDGEAERWKNYERFEKLRRWLNPGIPGPTGS